MNSITIKAADAVSIASLVHNVGTDKSLPVLTEIEIKLTAGEITSAGTDRFTATIYRCTGDGPDGVMRISTIAAKWIITNVKPINKHYTPAPVVIEYDPENCNFTISHNGATLSGFWVKSNFPAIVPLIDTWQPETDAKPVTLNSNFLVRLNKFLREFKKVELWAVELGKNANGSTTKPGPVRAVSGGFTFLLQPNLIREP